MFRRNAFTAWHRTGAYTILIPVERRHGEVLNNTLVLKGSGPLLWQALESPCSLDDLVELLVAEYEVTSEVARADVRHFLDRLVEWQAVEFFSVS